MKFNLKNPLWKTNCWYKAKEGLEKELRERVRLFHEENVKYKLTLSYFALLQEVLGE